MNHRPLLAALLTVPALAIAAQAATVFRDIPPQHWARKPAGILADAKVMVGRTPVDFAGEVPLTRYELAMTLSQLYVQEGPPPTFLVLRDMSPGHEATLAVQRVIGFGLLPPRQPSVFDGDGTVSRRDMVVALDTLLDKNGVSPPARRRDAAFFSDIPQKSPLFPVLDRVVNRFGLLDVHGRTAFQPNDTVTRFQFLSALIKGMAYLNRPLDLEIKEATRPSPTPGPSLEPGETPRPGPSPTDERPIYMPMATFAPSPVPTWAPPVGGAILKTRARAALELLFTYSETLPTEPGSYVPGEQPEFSGVMLPGGGVAGEYWGDRAGATLDVRSYYVGLSVPHNNVDRPIDVLDTFVQGYGWYKIGSGPSWELALGGGGVFRNAYNLSADLLGTYYLTSDKTYVGAGPGLMWGYRFMPGLDLTSSLLVYPMLQNYNLRINGAVGNKNLTRVGSDLTTRLSYRLGPWTLDGGLHAFLGAGLTGGSQMFIGATAGAGMVF